MNEHRYILEPYKGMNTRHVCPACNTKLKTFTRYIDKYSGESIHPNVGRCDRESNCGYHLTPKQFFSENPTEKELCDRYARTRAKCSVMPSVKKQASFIPGNLFKSSLRDYETNHFVKFLVGVLGEKVTSEVVNRHFIGTSRYWNGATVFWQIDTMGKVRTGKIMQYDPTSGKRVKKPFNHINWVHKVIEQPDFELRQCLFGEHLLMDKTKPVAVVESEKTAVIASVYLPQFIWLAVGSLTNLNAEKCRVLAGRTVTLFPDLNGFEKWSSKAKELSHITTFNVSDLLERKATMSEREKGLDLADYLLNFDFRVFYTPNSSSLII